MLSTVNFSQNRQVAFQGRASKMADVTGAIIKHTTIQVLDTTLKGFGPGMMAGFLMKATGADTKLAVITGVFTAIAAKLNNDGIAYMEAVTNSAKKRLTQNNIFKHIFGVK